MEWLIKTISEKNIPFLRRKIGIIFQDFQLLKDRTVYKNLEFVLDATGWGKQNEKKDRIENCLQKVHISDLSNKFPSQLSGGQKQKVAIARATINSVFSDMSETQQHLLHRDLNRPDHVCACEFTVGELNANQRRMAMQPIRKHNAYGHPSREALRCVLQQSHIKSERELARHVDLMPLCNSCLAGKNRKGHKHKLTAATPSAPAKFMQK